MIAWDYATKNLDFGQGTVKMLRRGEQSTTGCTLTATLTSKQYRFLENLVCQRFSKTVIIKPSMTSAGRRSHSFMISPTSLDWSALSVVRHAIHRTCKFRQATRYAREYSKSQYAKAVGYAGRAF